MTCVPVITWISRQGGYMANHPDIACDAGAQPGTLEIILRSWAEFYKKFGRPAKHLTCTQLIYTQLKCESQLSDWDVTGTPKFKGMEVHVKRNVEDGWYLG